MESNQQNRSNGENESAEQTPNSNGQNPNPNDNTQSIANRSEGSQCPVCQNPIANRALTDTCLHEFCFECLRQSSLRNNHCPHCQTQYANIIHNIQSNSQFQQTRVNDPDSDHMFIISVVIDAIQGLQKRLCEERQRLIEEVTPMRNRSENQKNGIAVSETHESVDFNKDSSMREKD